MRIYFSGSIVGGRKYKKYQERIVACLESLGHEVVSREHAFQKEIETVKGITAPKVFERNLWWLVHKSEAVVAEVSLPSTGLGMELGFASLMDLPVLTLAYEKAEPISTLVKGNTLSNYKFAKFSDNDLEKKITDWLATLSVKARGGRYIAFEGLNSSGKGTQVAKLEQKLKKKGYKVWVCNEPGTTWLGQELRRLLQMQNEEIPVTRAEVAMLMAQRAQLVEKEILPRLSEGVTVLSDRSEGTSLAFQGLARGQGLIRVAALNGYALDGVRPDLVLYLKSERDLLRGRKKETEHLDRFEKEGETFEELCYQGYEKAVELDMLTPPHRWAVIDASQTIEQVHREIWSIVRPKLAKI